MAKPRKPSKAVWDSARIKALRESLGLLQKEAAAYLRISPQLWGDWEAGHREPVPAMQLLLDQLESGKLPPPK
jgi:DNA-binding transcriptional regulator YiaG